MKALQGLALALVGPVSSTRKDVVRFEVSEGALEYTKKMEACVISYACNEFDNFRAIALNEDTTFESWESQGNHFLVSPAYSHDTI